MPQHRAGAEKLVQSELAVEDVAPDQPELTLEIPGRQHPAAEDRGLEVGREASHLRDHRIGRALALVGPGAAIGKRIAEVLAEEACHVASRRREGVVHGAGDQDLDDGLRGPARLARGHERTIHECKRGREDDAGAVVRLRVLSRQCAEVGELRKRHVHAEGRRLALVMPERLAPLPYLV